MELFFEIEPTIGENLCIETDYFDTVLQIKEKIQKHRGIPISDQTLVFKRSILKDDLCIQYAEIPDKSHIRLLVATPDHATTSALPDNDSALDEMIREVAAESTFPLPQPSNSAINETTTTADHLHYTTATSSLISPQTLDHHTSAGNFGSSAPSPQILDHHTNTSNFRYSAPSPQILNHHTNTSNFGSSAPSPQILDHYRNTSNFGYPVPYPPILDHHTNAGNFGYRVPSPPILDHHTNAGNFGYPVPSPPILDRTNVVSNFGNSASSTSPLQSSLSADPAAFGFHPSSGNAAPPLTPHLLQSSLSADPGFQFGPNFGNAAPFTHRPVSSLSADPGFQFRLNFGKAAPFTHRPVSSLSADQGFQFRPNFGNAAAPFTHRPLSSSWFSPNFGNGAPFTHRAMPSLSSAYPDFGFRPSTPVIPPWSSPSAYPGFGFMPNFGNAGPFNHRPMPSLSGAQGHLRPFTPSSGNLVRLTPPPLPSVSASPGSANRGLKRSSSDRTCTQYFVPPTFKPIIKMPDASKLNITFDDLKEPIASLKERIRKRVGDVAVDRLVVVVDGFDVEDHKALRECGLTCNSEIEVVELRPSPASTAASGSSVDKLSIIVLTQHRAKRYSLEVNFSDTPEDLRRRLQEMKERLELYVPDRFLLFHNKKIMQDAQSFRWHNASQGDEIEVFAGYITTDVYGREALHFR